MKRYKISVGCEVNSKASKTGIKYRFFGRTDDPEKIIGNYKEHPEWYGCGLKVTDDTTNEVVWEG